VAADVGQRFLGRAVHSEASVGGQLPGVAVHIDGDREPALLGDRLGQVADPLGAGERVTARGGDRPPRLVETAGGQAVGLVDRARHFGVDAAVVGEQAGALELQRQRGQGVREDVVHLARQAAPLGGGGGPSLARLRVRQGAVLLAHAPHLAHDQEPRYGADQRAQRVAPVLAEAGDGPEDDQVESEDPHGQGAIEAHGRDDGDVIGGRLPQTVGLDRGEDGGGRGGDREGHEAGPGAPRRGARVVDDDRRHERDQRQRHGEASALEGRLGARGRRADDDQHQVAHADHAQERHLGGELLRRRAPNLIAGRSHPVGRKEAPHPSAEPDHRANDKPRARKRHRLPGGSADSQLHPRVESQVRPPSR
jgi:hypothetical protein